MYDKSLKLSTINEYNQLRRVNPRFSAALSRYHDKTIAQFIYEYNSKGLKGKAVYDQLMVAIAPEDLLPEELKEKAPIEKYSQEDLLRLKEKELPYVSNVDQSIGKLMEIIINQAIVILEHHTTDTAEKYATILRSFFLEHKSIDDIAQICNDSKWNIQGNILNKFMKGDKYHAHIVISNDFKQRVQEFMGSMLYKTCNTSFEDNDIDSIEKITFALNLSGYVMLNDMKEWDNAQIVIEDSKKIITRQHLTSLKKAICDAIVPVPLSTLISNTKAEFIKYCSPQDFNPQIIESFVRSNPWIKTDDDDRYYILTQELTSIYQRQGRIIYEAGGLIHYKEVKARYEAIYKDSYNTQGIQNTLTKRSEQDFFPYGGTGLWYYSEDGIKLKPANKVIEKFVDENICFYWKDLADIVSQLLKIRKFNKRQIRLEITNLCYVDNNDKDHFVKKGEEGNFLSFSWSKGRQNRTNWCVNHAYEMLKDSPNGEMKWSDFENQFKQDLLETGRPMKVVEDIKYRHSGSADKERIFILENNVIRLNEDVLRNKYNGDLSMYGLYRKSPEFYNIILSFAMTELRKQQKGEMLLVDFIDLALKNIDSEENNIDDSYIRKIFETNDNLPQGLSRYNDNGSVYIMYDKDAVNEDTKDDPQYNIVTTQSSDDTQAAPQLTVSTDTRMPVTYTTRFNWDDVKKALKTDLVFYDSPFWYQGITSDLVLEKFVKVLSSSKNYNLNDIVPQIIYEFHYARIDRYDHYQYLRNLPIAFEALLREIYESAHRPIKTNGIKDLCEKGFTEYYNALSYHDKKGFGRILDDLVHKRNLLLHGSNLELSPVTLVQNIVEYIALFVYTVNKYALED